MNPAAHWSRVNALFQEALDLPPQMRESFIEREAGGDATLAVELREMLACAAGAGDGIANAVRSAAEALSGRDGSGGAWARTESCASLVAAAWGSCSRRRAMMRRIEKPSR